MNVDGEVVGIEWIKESRNTTKYVVGCGGRKGAKGEPRSLIVGLWLVWPYREVAPTIKDAATLAKRGSILQT